MNERIQTQFLGLGIVAILLFIVIVFVQSNVTSLIRSRAKAADKVLIGQKIQLPHLLDIHSGNEFDWSIHENENKIIIFLNTCSICAFDSVFTGITEISKKFDLPIVGIGRVISPIDLKKFAYSWGG